MNNEMLYAILLLRQAYVTVLFQCAYVQNEYYTRKMNYDAMWLLMRTTVFSILMMPISYSHYIMLFHIHIPSLGVFWFSSLKASGEEETKKFGKLEFDMPTNTNTNTLLFF